MFFLKDSTPSQHGGNLFEILHLPAFGLRIPDFMEKDRQELFIVQEFPDKHPRLQFDDSRILGATTPADIDPGHGSQAPILGQQSAALFAVFSDRFEQDFSPVDGRHG